MYFEGPCRDSKDIIHRLYLLYFLLPEKKKKQMGEKQSGKGEGERWRQGERNREKQGDVELNILKCVEKIQKRTLKMSTISTILG